jgi:hypothetical protein
MNVRRKRKRKMWVRGSQRQRAPPRHVRQPRGLRRRKRQKQHHEQSAVEEHLVERGPQLLPLGLSLPGVRLVTTAVHGPFWLSSVECVLVGTPGVGLVTYWLSSTVVLPCAK